MVVLTFQLIVVFTVVTGRYAYKEYSSDNSNEYRYDSNSNSSQINPNEAPGK